MDRKALLAGMCEAVVKASGVIMHHYENDIEVMEKGDRSPVTIADQKAEVIILEELKRIAPGIPVVAEESVSEGRIPVDLGQRFFLVDPLDGTKEFLKRNGEFTVNIGLIENGVPTMGAVYAPALDRLFFGAEGLGAFVQTVRPTRGAQDLKANKPEAITVRSAPEDGIIAVTSRSHMDDQTKTYLEGFKVAALKPSGSSLKFCLVATGEADLYPRFGPTCEWDVAAAHAVLHAAGGTVEVTDGGPMVYGKADVCFLNPGFIAKGAL